MEQQVKGRLLALARQTVEAEVRRLGPGAIGDDWPDLPHAGAFVTLRVAGRLRGCIGTFHPSGTLPQTVREMAGSACHDPRFEAAPILCEELPSLSIQVSVLSPLQHTTAPLGLQPGVHGIYIRRGASVGCFLPQVASEMNWDAETFLEQCCVGKAGLPSYAWQDPDTEVYLFTTTCLSESD